jgi:hypothetical protein
MPEETVDIVISIPRLAYEAALESFPGSDAEKKLALNSQIKVHGLQSVKDQGVRHHGEDLEEKIRAKDFLACETPSTKKDLVEGVVDASKFNGQDELIATVVAEREAARLAEEEAAAAEEGGEEPS